MAVIVRLRSVETPFPSRTSPQLYPQGKVVSEVARRLSVLHAVCCRNLWRETSEEKRELERLEANLYNDVRQASEVHREVCDAPTAGSHP